MPRFSHIQATIIGLVAVAGTLAWCEKMHTFVATGTRTQGTVTGLSERTSNNTRTFVPVVSFQDSSGKAVKFFGSVGRNPPGYHIGETVPVLYPAAAPSTAVIDNFVSIWTGPLITGVLGTLFLAFGLGGFVRARV